MTIRLLRGLGRSALYSSIALFALAAPAAAQGVMNGPPGPAPAAQPANAPPAAASPVCGRLEGQLASINNGNAAQSSRAAQIKQAEDAVAKQQADLDRAVIDGRKQGCEGTGFLSIFSSLSPQCGPVTQHIQQIRGTLDRMMSDLEALKSGSDNQDDQRRAVLGQLAQNNCGAQYTAAANAAGGPRGFFDALFGGGNVVTPGGDGAPAGTFHTVCVRTCDGYYFPISYSTTPSHFPDDQRVCQRECPAAEANLYAFRNPGEDMTQAMSINGQPYTALPAAFQYRKQFTPACSCRRPGQSWADALKDADDSSTLESGDIVVTDQNAKALSQAPQPKGAKGGATPAPNASAVPAQPASTGSAASTDSAKKTVRTVGTPFVAPQTDNQH
ncbi:MAG: DUF2865 domain-containing protein [Xanthobacteraceae bacterium]|jgi:hypothetical protein